MDFVQQAFLLLVIFYPLLVSRIQIDITCYPTSNSLFVRVWKTEPHVPIGCEHNIMTRKARFRVVLLLTGPVLDDILTQFSSMLLKFFKHLIQLSSVSDVGFPTRFILTILLGTTTSVVLRFFLMCDSVGRFAMMICSLV